MGKVARGRELDRGAKRVAPSMRAPVHFLAAVAAWLGALHAGKAVAESDPPPGNFELGVSYGAGIFTVANANFGAGSYDVRDVRDFYDGVRPDAGEPRADSTWTEFYLKPELRFKQDVAGGEIFGALSAVYAQTIGDGDAYFVSLTRGNPGSVELEEAYIGYKKFLPSDSVPQSVAVQLGAQNFWLGDGFLVQLARLNLGDYSGYYLTPRTAFSGFGTVRVNTSPVRADFFLLETPVDNKRAYGDADFPLDQPRTRFAGFDVEWFENAAHEGANGAEFYWDRHRYLNFTYLNIVDADASPLYSDIGQYWSRRDGLHVLSASAGGALLPTSFLNLRENGRLYGQYVRQLNNSDSRRVDAEAYYIEPAYTFPKLPWSPQIYYRYSRFSGQSGDPWDQSATKTSYDPLFLGGGIRDLFGNFTAGEVMGVYNTASSNLRTHQVSLKLTAPFHILSDADSLSVQLIGFDLSYDKPRQVGATSRRFARELDLAIQYNVDHQTIVAFAMGVATPGKGGREAMAANVSGFPDRRAIDDDTVVAELFFIRSW